jgi:hypothetical protein
MPGRWTACLLWHQRRLLAAAQERLAQALFDEATPAADIVTLLEEEALRVQAALRDTTAGSCTCTLRINTPGSPTDRHKDKKV